MSTKQLFVPMALIGICLPYGQAAVWVAANSCRIAPYADAHPPG